MLKQAIQEGLDSGVIDRTVRDIWTEAEARYRARSAQVLAERPRRGRSWQDRRLHH